MFGTNPIRKYEDRPDALQVREIFYTIQGEGPHSGLPAVFVRLTGCNLACTFCDTKWDDALDGVFTPKDIWGVIEAQAKDKTRLVVLTGGEPLRQNLALFLALMPEGWTAQIETAGTLWQGCLDINRSPMRRVQVVVSPKTPAVRREFHATPGLVIAWKYVIREGQISDEDGLPMGSTQRAGVAQRLARPWDHSLIATDKTRANVWLSPCDEHDVEATRANMLAVGRVAMKHGYRAMVQLHKLLEVA